MIAAEARHFQRIGDATAGFFRQIEETGRIAEKISAAEDFALALRGAVAGANPAARARA